jgi:hypothetical protein
MEAGMITLTEAADKGFSDGKRFVFYDRKTGNHFASNYRNYEQKHGGKRYSYEGTAW